MPGQHDYDVPHAYEVDFDPETPALTLAMPTEIFNRLVYTEAELVGILGAGIVKHSTACERDKELLLFQRNIQVSPDYFKEVKAAIVAIIGSVREMMERGGIADEVIDNQTFWRILIGLNTDLQDSVSPVMINEYDERDHNGPHVSLQWNEDHDKGFIRIKARTLNELQEMAIRAVEKVLADIG